MRTALWMLYVICIIYYMLCILYMIPLSVNANGVFTLICTFFYLYIFKSILKKMKMVCISRMKDTWNDKKVPLGSQMYEEETFTMRAYPFIIWIKNIDRPNFHNQETL